MDDKTKMALKAVEERLHRFRFRVVAPDGRELLSDTVHVRLPSTQSGEPAQEIANFAVTGMLVAVKGKKQGTFKTESARLAENADKHQFAALALDYQLRSPRDAATGQISGRRQHHPLSIVKEWGAATPQLFQALVANEVLETVEIDCYGPVAGKESLVYKVKLTNAHVVSIRQIGGAKEGPGELETVAFIFEKIEHSSPADAVLASDDTNPG